VFDTAWTLDVAHAHAPGTTNAIISDASQILLPMVESGGGLALAAVATLVLVPVMDHLFSPDPRRRFGPRER
jgi:hypothetical protein